jgi:hypothetical protein
VANGRLREWALMSHREVVILSSARIGDRYTFEPFVKSLGRSDLRQNARTVALACISLSAIIPRGAVVHANVRLADYRNRCTATPDHSPGGGTHLEIAGTTVGNGAGDRANVTMRCGLATKTGRPLRTAAWLPRIALSTQLLSAFRPRSLQDPRVTRSKRRPNRA